MKDYYFIRKWKSEMKRKVKLLHPDMGDKTINDYLEKIITTKFKDRECYMRNSYREKEAKSSLLNIIQYAHDRKPICAGYGVMYLNQDQCPNPNALMLKESIDKRKELKKRRKQYDKRSYEFLMLDIAQGNEKVIANSFYGANGSKTATFYNVDIASSVTATGQAEISTAETSFEGLLSNNTKFYDMDECLLYMSRIIDEDYEYKDIPIPKNVKKILFERLKTMFLYSARINFDLIKEIIRNLTEEQCAKIYYKNNLIEFFRSYKPANKLLKKLINKTKSFRDPNKIPKEIEDDLKQLYSYIKCFCVYNYTVRNRINRDKYHPRMSCVTQDTDSTMVTLQPLMDYFMDEIADEEVAAENMDEFTFIMVNIICYFLTEYSHTFLKRYCKSVNIKEENYWMINMKNEFYYPILLDTDSKKHYITLTKLQEGVEIKPPKIEIHGLEMAKAETSLKTKAFFFSIIRDDIMYAKSIDVAKIIRKIETFKQTIHDALHDGDTSFLPLKSVKELEAYDTPYSEQGIRAVRTWNLFYKDMQINLPDKVLALPISCEKKKKYDELKEYISPDYQQIIEDDIFNSDEKSIRTSGFNIIAIPQTVEKIPDWLIPLIDYSKVIDDNVNKFNAILKSLGAVTLKTRANSTHMSNIISF